MIVYDQAKWYGYHKLIQMRGSVLPRTFPRCIVASLAVLVIDYYDMIYFPRSPYAHQVFTFGLSFLVIMRTNLAYSRYWEGISEASTMQTKWMDAVTQILAFDELSKPPAADTGELFRHRMLHLVSLLGATSILELQGDDDDALDEDDSPFEDSLDCLVEFDMSHIEKLRFNPINHKNLAQIVPEEKEHLVDDDFDRYRFSVLPIIGQLEESTRHGLQISEHKVHYIMTRVIRLVSQRISEGGMAAPPPVVSRVYQELSNGLLGFQQAKKVADIPFPFPYAQIVQYLQLAFVISCPFVVMSFVSDAAPAMIFTFLAVFCYVSLNEVATELEDPFGTDPNDLPLHRLHLRFVHQLYQLGTSESSKEDLMTLVTGPAKVQAREERDRKQAIAKSEAGSNQRKRRGSGVDMMMRTPDKQLVQVMDTPEMPPRRMLAIKEETARETSPPVIRAALSNLSDTSEARLGEEVFMANLHKDIEERRIDNIGVYHGGKLTLEESVMQLFKELDIDQSESLQREEVEVLCTRLGVRHSQSKFDKLMLKVDPDSTNTVTFDMFLKWAKKCEKRQKRKAAAQKGEHAALSQSLGSTALSDDDLSDSTASALSPAVSRTGANRNRRSSTAQDKVDEGVEESNLRGVIPAKNSTAESPPASLTLQAKEDEQDPVSPDSPDSS